MLLYANIVFNSFNIHQLFIISDSFTKNGKIISIDIIVFIHLELMFRVIDIKNC